MPACIRCAPASSQSSSIYNSLSLELKENGLETFAFLLRHTQCPAVLIENFFMDNKKDLAYLLSQEGRREIIETIINDPERCVYTLVSG